MSEALNNDPALVLVCCCGLLCTHLRDPVPHFRRHPFSDYGLASVCVCVCVCVAKLGLGLGLGWGWGCGLGLGGQTQLLYVVLIYIYLIVINQLVIRVGEVHKKVSSKDDMKKI